MPDPGFTDGEYIRRQIRSIVRGMLISRFLYYVGCIFLPLLLMLYILRQFVGQLLDRSGHIPDNVDEMGGMVLYYIPALAIAVGIISSLRYVFNSWVLNRAVLRFNRIFPFGSGARAQAVMVMEQMDSSIFSALAVRGLASRVVPVSGVAPQDVPGTVEAGVAQTVQQLDNAADVGGNDADGDDDPPARSGDLPERPQPGSVPDYIPLEIEGDE